MRKSPFLITAHCAQTIKRERDSRTPRTRFVAERMPFSGDVGFFPHSFFFRFFLPFITIAQLLAGSVCALTRRSVNQQRNNDYGKGEADT